jgi:hypothetical protein
MPAPSLLDTRTSADHLADAAHFESWADRVADNAGLQATFRRLAGDARRRARESAAAIDRGGQSQASMNAPGYSAVQPPSIV